VPGFPPAGAHLPVRFSVRKVVYICCFACVAPQIVTSCHAVVAIFTSVSTTNWRARSSQWGETTAASCSRYVWAAEGELTQTRQRAGVCFLCSDQLWGRREHWQGQA
jgi:hypothetical protein